MVAARKKSRRRIARTTAGGLKKLYRRWRSTENALPDTLWSKTLRTSPYARALPKTDQARLRELSSRLLASKSFEGALGVAVNNAMRARIALHAGIPVLNLGLDYYAEWMAVVIYPGDFRVHDEYMDEHGVVHREMTDLCGQSLSQGPIVLSWESILEEDKFPSDYNLVIHECAHKLDVLNGAANGFPPLHSDMQARAWARDFHDAYRQLCATHDAKKRCRIDPYATENPAEFFAVMTETFFTQPRLIYQDFPAVYAHLQNFYRQDPLKVLDRKPS
ncbi:MAG: zinc-dependent peptidase [Sulfuricaulis sp.]|nr:zinc-dependent peptidase [Sulfuricaulis sp.]